MAAEVVVGLVEGVEEVGDDDDGVDRAAMGVEAGGARLWTWGSGADCEGVIDGLEPAGDELKAIRKRVRKRGIDCSRNRRDEDVEERTWGRKDHPRREMKPDMVVDVEGVYVRFCFVISEG